MARRGRYDDEVPAELNFAEALQILKNLAMCGALVGGALLLVTNLGAIYDVVTRLPFGCLATALASPALGESSALPDLSACTPSPRSSAASSVASVVSTLIVFDDDDNHTATVAPMVTADASTSALVAAALVGLFALQHARPARLTPRHCTPDSVRERATTN